jgi:1-acyl-sn-glycerol-3-phosphate acyltransferase
VLSLLGWRLEGGVPDVPRCVVIVAPHTSNWDFVVAMGALLALGLRGRWLGKNGLFRPPLGALLRWTGGVPVDRSSAVGVAEQAAASLRAEPFFLGIAPEGTRRRVERWKTGFHRIARGAGTGIWPVVLDYRTRVFRLLPLFEPTDDLDGDMARLRSLYHASMARYPKNYVDDAPAAERIA